MRATQWPLLRTATFRLTVGAALFTAAALLLLSALIFWQATHYRNARTDMLLRRETSLLAAQTMPVLDHQLRSRAFDLHLLITAFGLFSSDHRRLSGNLADWPRGLVADGSPHWIRVAPIAAPARLVRIQASRLPGGDILVLARGTGEVEELQRIVWHALAVCAVPSLLLAVLGGVWLSHRAMLRVGIMHRAIERIMQGDLHERLPAAREGGGDDLDRLAGSVNHMLGRLEHLLDEIKGVGDDIAHDLRTPLTRVRTRLERARSEMRGAGPHEGVALDSSIERAIADLDQCFAIITALLRITEIENGRRRAAFARISLNDIAASMIDLYEPVAEAAGITLVAQASEAAWTYGDRDLLIELAANLVDNAIKFTATGGRVEIGVRHAGARAVFNVDDTGIGIPASEREAVLVRFYRSDKSRHVRGSGLGLSLVAAIARLHDASLDIGDTIPGGEPPGCRFRVSLAAATF
ncbi:sensor histidine kinase [Lichenicoccus sp.]|uniref:sensor histidine kinase n=1 Tax=Lichenicoccus sp. TaxID=2781899 RepID=UPI003D0B2F46